jgi:uncharacterized membrane protein (DUF485 family)
MVEGAAKPGAPDSDRQRESEATTGASSGLGLMLFAAYLVAYTGFVLVSAFSPSMLEATPLAGVNVAILYGMALIAGAFILAVGYAWALRRKTK